MLRKSWFIITGPTICTTSGLCVPGASCAVPERFVWACFVRFPWANNATAIPRRQNTEAVKMRRLKKADCEVDLFFIDEVSFSLRSRVAILSDTPEMCQHFFKFLPKFSLKRFKPRITWISRMTQRSEIQPSIGSNSRFSRKYNNAVTIWRPYPQEKSVPPANMPKNFKEKCAISALARSRKFLAHEYE